MIYSYIYICHFQNTHFQNMVHARLATRNLKRPEFSVHPTLEMDHGGIQRIDSKVKLRETVVSTSARIRYLRYFYVFLEIGKDDDRWVWAMGQESNQWGVSSIRVVNAQKMTCEMVFFRLIAMFFFQKYSKNYYDMLWLYSKNGYGNNI